MTMHLSLNNIFHVFKGVEVVHVSQTLIYTLFTFELLQLLRIMTSEKNASNIYQGYA